MLIVPPETLLTVFFCLAMGGLYLRFVAKEVHRRDRYLQVRLDEKIAEAERALGRANEEADADEDIIELQEVDAEPEPDAAEAA